MTSIQDLRLATRAYHGYGQNCGVTVTGQTGTVTVVNHLHSTAHLPPRCLGAQQVCTKGCPRHHMACRWQWKWWKMTRRVVHPPPSLGMCFLPIFFFQAVWPQIPHECALCMFARYLLPSLASAPHLMCTHGNFANTYWHINWCVDSICKVVAPTGAWV